jgi:hypothetical protein
MIGLYDVRWHVMVLLDSIELEVEHKRINFRNKTPMVCT